MTKAWDVLPEKFIERLNDLLPQDKKEAILESFTKRHPPTFRANILKISANELAEQLAQQNKSYPIE